jgi:signal transduction histidine kinase/ligand-binding sensor domain-containing protein/CheY-like chemotaxis protein
MKTLVKTLIITILLLGPLSAPTYGQDGDDPIPPPDFPAQDPKFTHITIEQGLSDQRVHAILQDSAGFMWFGTVNGLNRYDGYNIEEFRHDPTDPHSLTGNWIDDLYEDSSGTIWVATRSGLNAFDRRTELFTRYLHDPEDPHSLSSNVVITVHEDPSGVMWIGTLGGLNRFDRTAGTFTAFRHDPSDPESLSNDLVLEIHEDRAGVMWIGTHGGGLNRFDRATGAFTTYRHDPADPGSLSHNTVWDIHEDRSGTLWVATDGGGLNRYDRATDTFTAYRHDPDDPLSIGYDQLDSIFEDAGGALWIGTFGGGLSVLDSDRETFTTFRSDPGNPASLSNNGIADISVDRAGLIWIGTQGGGVDIYSPQRQAFAIYRHDPEVANSLASDKIWTVYEDQDGVLWIGTMDRGLDRFDRQSGQVSHYPPDPENPQRLGHPYVSAIEGDRTGALWVGSYGGGLYRLDSESGDFSAFRHDPADPQSLSHDIIGDLHIDASGVLWVGTAGGLNRYDPASDTFTTFPLDPDNPQSSSQELVWVITEDPRGYFWIGTFGSGLYHLEPETGQVTHYRHDPDDPTSLSDNTIWSIHIDRSGVLWVGTAGGGLNRFDPDDGSFSHYREEDGLASDRIVAIVEDDDADNPTAGNLWIATGKGLSKLDRDRKTFRTYSVSGGLPLAEFNRGGLKIRNGDELLLGSLGGMIAFAPETFRDDAYVPPVVFTDFLLANGSVKIGADSPLQQAIDQTDEIKLSYADQVISFEFAALSYHAPNQNRYRYRLEGFEEDWIEVDSSRRLVTYTNLDPGEYTFKVLGSNSDGVWNEEGTLIRITITPPWWGTWWFRAGILLSLAGLVVGGFMWQRQSARRRERQLEIQVAERTRELGIAKEKAEVANQAKSTFLAAMSHELRTPLNAILGFGRNLARAQELTPEHRQEVDIIRRSGDHLLEMIDEVLSLSRIEAGRVELQPAPFDLVLTLEDIAQMITVQIQAKGLRFDLELDATLPRVVQGDVGKIRQVLINLLGNAVKFTEHGYVCLRACPKPLNNDPARVLLQLDVEDSGVGIPEEQLDTIFESFVQGNHTGNGAQGTGLGLAICRSLVDMMEGRIEVTSKPGEGSLFMVTVPLELAEASMLDEPQVIGLKSGKTAWRILVVDDDPYNRALLTTMLGQIGFKVREATNGETAVEAFQEWHPHLICMDMRMPVMDGYAATKAIRELPGGEQVKILAVTASAFDEQRDDILDAGCDEMVRKPVQEHDIFAAIERQLGVEYRYAPTETHAAEAGVELTAEMLSELPPELIEELRHATLLLDRAAMAVLIERIKTYAPDTAKGLQVLVDDFQFERIRDLLGDVR